MNRVFDIKSGHDFSRYRNSIQVICFQINEYNLNNHSDASLPKHGSDISHNPVFDFRLKASSYYYKKASMQNLKNQKKKLKHLTQT